MGLDMYLSARKHLSKYSGGEGMAKELRDMFDVPPSGNLETVEVSFEVGYWRKANQVHAWFVRECADGVDECQPVYVEKDKLLELLGICRRILRSTELTGAKVVNGYSFEKGDDGSLRKKANLQDGKVMKDESLAIELLPCQEGFFFGSTGYDQWYWQDLESTVEILENALKLEGFDYEYRASW
jgi:hypothetical protein